MGAFSLKKWWKTKNVLITTGEKQLSHLPPGHKSLLHCLCQLVCHLVAMDCSHTEEGFNGTFSCYFACLTFCQLVIIFVGSIKHCRLQCSSLKLFLIIVYESRIFIWTSGVLPHCALCLWPCTKSIYEWENEVFFSLFLLKLLNKKGTDIKKCERRRRLAEYITLGWSNNKKVNKSMLGPDTISYRDCTFWWRIHLKLHERDFSLPTNFNIIIDVKVKNPGDGCNGKIMIGVPTLC